ncbi:hypothetical protein WJX81_001089 [Elliptochloris bilobata]|uniref:Gamma-soluble NSF attachment protein n=1 Tax=Elliptochloris bilobata TaxID=381761 RepID=A0AAW1REG7_9CHLO
MHMASEGDELVKRAEKLCALSVLQLRLKPDWPAATALYEQAAKCFSQAKAFGKARLAHERAAHGHDRQGAAWQSAKELAKAAEAAQHAGDWGDVAPLWRAAALAYATASRQTAAADALAKGALALEQHDPKAACELHQEAIEALEREGKAGASGDVYRQAIGASLRMGRSAEGVCMLLRWAAAAGEAGLHASQAKAYLGAVVVWLHAGDAAQADAVYQDAMDVAVFARSEQAAAGGTLLDAYRSGSAERVRRCVAGALALFGDLDNQVARLARKLPDGDLQAMAAVLAGASAPFDAGLDEADLT